LSSPVLFPLNILHRVRYTFQKRLYVVNFNGYVDDVRGNVELERSEFYGIFRGGYDSFCAVLDRIFDKCVDVSLPVIVMVRKCVRIAKYVTSLPDQRKERCGIPDATESSDRRAVSYKGIERLPILL
jgi:hypothetical protein